MGARMGKMILVDSNVIIYHFNNITKATEFLNANRGNMAISTITVAEILSFAPSELALKMAEKFLIENFKWIDVSREIIFKTAEIRRQRKTKTPDAIIGATALIYHLTLASRNETDFKHLPLDFVNPIDS